MHLIWLACAIEGAFACWSQGELPIEYRNATPPPIKQQTKDHLDRNKAVAWGGWTPPSNVLDEWRQWLDNINAQIKNKDSMDDMDPAKREELKKQRGPGSGWPYTWADLGEGTGGIPIPPWAYVPKNTGKPYYCYLPPKRGNCNEDLTRWGYNPYIDQCSKFEYSGCDGNKNNFVDELKCVQECVATPPPECVS